MPVSRKQACTAFLLVWDFLAAALAVALSLRLRFGFVRDIPPFYLDNQGMFIAVCALVFWGCCLPLEVYSRSLRPLSSSFALRLGVAAGLAAGVVLLLDRVLALGVPVEVIAIFAALLFCLGVAGRLLPAFLLLLWARFRNRRSPGRPVAIVGAGELGRYLAEKLQRDPAHPLSPVLFVDDSRRKRGKKIAGVIVAGGLGDLELLHGWYHFEQVILAIHELPAGQVSRLLDDCRRLGLPLRRFGLWGGPDELGLAKLRDIAPEELLGRPGVTLDLEAVAGLVRGRVAMVTGGAGSIGSELCSQLLKFGAARVVVFDINENGLFELGHRLAEDFEPSRFVTAVGSVRDRARLTQVLEQHRPALVLHAAAHKHVPMMEQNPLEAVKNNIFGTLNTAELAAAAGAERFILISTDKAVNPANVMGATKRAAEIIVQVMNASGSGTRYSAVRFGNVLGSQGSVVPLFKKQIAAGGPVTVTHPDMTRYFMTIPEAVQLVLEAAALAGGGEIFVLDMGEPVRVVELAESMIRLSGHIPGEDMDIVFCGMRPGEKLYEELTLAEEVAHRTAHEKIFVNAPVSHDGPAVAGQLEELRRAVDARDEAAALSLLSRLVPTFRR